MKNLRNIKIIFIILLFILCMLSKTVNPAYIEPTIPAPGDTDSPLDGVSNAEKLNLPQQLSITSDYGPRNVKGGSSFHFAMDYRRPKRAHVPAIAELDCIGIIIGKSLLSFGFVDYQELESWRYLHMFENFDSNRNLPVTEGDFTLASMGSGNSPPYAVIHWEKERWSNVYCLNEGNEGCSYLPEIHGNQLFSNPTQNIRPRFTAAGRVIIEVTDWSKETQTANISIYGHPELGAGVRDVVQCSIGGVILGEGKYDIGSSGLSISFPQNDQGEPSSLIAKEKWEFDIFPKYTVAKSAYSTDLDIIPNPILGDGDPNNVKYWPHGVPDDGPQVCERLEDLQDLETEWRLWKGDPLGPAGGQGGYDPHMHLEILNSWLDYPDKGDPDTTNPLFYIDHPRGRLNVEHVVGGSGFDFNETLECKIIYYASNLVNQANNRERIRCRVSSRVDGNFNGSLSATPEDPENLLNIRESPFDLDRVRFFLYPVYELEYIDFNNYNAENQTFPPASGEKISFKHNRYLINGDRAIQDCDSPEKPELSDYNNNPQDENYLNALNDYEQFWHDFNNKLLRADFIYGGRPDQVNGIQDKEQEIPQGLIYPGFIDDHSDFWSDGQKTGIAPINYNDIGKDSVGVDFFIFSSWCSKISIGAANSQTQNCDCDIDSDIALLNLDPTPDNTEDDKYYARYPDGAYVLAAYAEDVNRNDAHSHLSIDKDRNGLIDDDEKEMIVIDNFRPYLKEVKITQNTFLWWGESIKYHAKWGSRKLENSDNVTHLKLTKIKVPDKNDVDFNEKDYVKAGPLKILLVFNEDIAIQKDPAKLIPLHEEDIAIQKDPAKLIPLHEHVQEFEDSNGNKFYILFDPNIALHYIFENSDNIHHINKIVDQDIKFIITREIDGSGEEYKDRGFNVIELEIEIPEWVNLSEQGKASWQTELKNSKGKALLGVHVRDLGFNANLPFNAQWAEFDTCDSTYCFDLEWINRDERGEFRELNNLGDFDILHHFFMDPKPSSILLDILDIVFESEPEERTRSKDADMDTGINADVKVCVIIEDDLSKVAYVKIDWGNGHIFEKVYDPPVEKVVEYQTYKQECEDKEYTIKVQSFDAAGNEQTNIIIDGQEYPEVTFTVLALKADYHLGFVVNRAANTVTVFETDPCGRAGHDIAQIEVGNKPFDVAARGDGRLYVANSEDGSLSIIDTQYDINTGAFEFTYSSGEQEYHPDNDIDLGPGFTPHFTVITPDGSRAYVADKSGCIKTVNLIYWTDYFHPSGGRVIYPPHTDLSKKNGIYSIEAITGNGEETIEDMAIDPAGRRLYVVVRNGYNQWAYGGKLLVYDIEYVISQHPGVINTFHRVLESIPRLIRKGHENPDHPYLNEPSGIAFTPDGDLVYLTGEGTIEFVNEIQNWADATGGVIVMDPQAIYDPALHNQGGGESDILDYIPPNVPGSKPKIQFIEAPRVDYSPFMGFGGGAACGLIYSAQEMYNSISGLQDQMVYEYPVDIDGAESIVISPDGRRAYVTFFNTNNFGIIDLEPSFAPAGYSAVDMPYHRDFYAVSEAILPSLNPYETDPHGWDRFPNDISLSRDGRYVIISNKGKESDLITLIDTHVVDDILTKLYNGNILLRVPEDSDLPKYLTMDDLKKYPIDKLPTDGINVYVYDPENLPPPLIRYIVYVDGINDPEGICTIPSFDTDEDLKYGGSSDLVEAKNRFNSLLNLPNCLSASSLISSQDNNILSPCREDFINHFNRSQAIGCPWGDNQNNYLNENTIDAASGKLRNGVLLPTEGMGYRHDYGYDPYNSDNAGTLELINVLEEVGRKWMDKHPEGPRIIYGDLSRPGGGQFMDIAPGGAEMGGVQRYAAHQNGLDVNVRYMRSDFSEDPPFDFVLSNNTFHERDNRYETEGGYHEEYTRELINLFLAQGEVEVIFVDPMVIELAEMAGEPFDSPRLTARGARDNSEEGSRRDHDDHFSVRIQYTNHPPVAEVAADTIIATGGDQVELDGSASMDPDYHQLTYIWTQKGEGGPEIELDDPQAAKPTFICPSADEADELIFGLIVYDGELESSEKVVSITINGRPVATASADKTSVEPGEQVTLDASSSYDPDDDEITYRWNQISGLPASVNNFNEATMTLTAPWEPSLSESITLTFSLVVSDLYADSEEDTLTITVNPPPNNPPIADAGPDQHVLIGYQDQVTLEGYGSHDLDNGFLTYQWSQTAGPIVGLSDETSPMPYFSITGITTSTTITFSLVVNDGRDDSAPDIVNIKLLTVKEGGIVINEVVISPQQDWSAVDFTGYSDAGGEIDPNDQWVEIYNNSAAAIDLSGWSIMMKDSTATRHFIGGGSGVEVFSEGSSLTNLLSGGFLVIGNPDGVMDNDCYLELLDAQDNVVDSLEIGDDYQEDGQGDGAPEPGQNGASTSYEDEAIARIRDGVDTDNDISDFEKSYATPGDFNFYEYPDESEF